MIQIVAYESGFCPECSDHTNSVLELEEYRNADVLSCKFCGYEEVKLFSKKEWDMSIDEILNPGEAEAGNAEEQPDRNSQVGGSTL